jgi:diacylglycerol kinase family enzyme
VEAGAELVIAVGGDGTVNEVARALLGSDTALGIVPVGSGNGLARALRLPLKPAPALAAIERGVRRRIDVGRLNGGLFLNVAGTGFDAAVGAAFQRAGAGGNRRGLLSYLRQSLGEALGYRPQPLVLEANGEPLSLTPFMVTFANGPQYGSGAVINPGGKLDDGRLEIVYFDDGPIGDILLAAPRLFTGGIEKASRYRRISTTRATLRAESPLVIHRDGDPVESAHRIEMEIVPGALEVVVPADTAADPDGPLTP